MKWVTIIGVYIALFTTTLWIIGAVVTDRWAWSQWLAWIPTPVVIMLLLIIFIAVVISKMKKLSFLLALLVIGSIGWFVFEENNFFSRNISNGLRIVGWTMSHPKKNVSSESAEKLIEFNGDITLLTHGWHVRGEKSIKEWIGANYKRIINGPFTLLTKLPVLEVKTLIASNGIYISLFRVDATEKIGKPINIWAIDLPSSLKTSRIETANRVRCLLSLVDVQEPDVVLGDFNMTRNSYAMKTMFPMLQDASDESGAGLLASFPANYSLYHIDHVLIDDDALTCQSYSLVNPNIGRHRVQIAEFVSN